MKSLRLFVCLIALSPVNGATFDVNSTADLIDVAPGDGTCLAANNKCTLRAAIQEANTSVASDMILVPIGVYNLTRADLKITTDMTIRGANMNRTIIDAGGKSRVFTVSSSKVAEIGTLTVRKGFMRNEYGGCIRNAGKLTLSFVIVTGCTGSGTESDGGGVANLAKLTIRNSQITSNTTERFGAGLYNHWSGAQLRMSRTTVSGNGTQVSGGGVINFGLLDVSESTFSDNSSVSYGGGGVDNGGTAILSRTTFSGNSGGEGGAIFTETDSDTTVTNCTISGNSGYYSGGVANWGRLVIQNSTLFGNRGQSDGSGGGLYNLTGRVVLKNSIVGGNRTDSNGRPDCYVYDWFGSSVNYSLIGNARGCNFPRGGASNLVNLDPMLSALADNGGRTKTHALRAGSVAIDSASPAAAGNANACAKIDQSGAPRPQNGRCDMGAYEWRPGNPASSR